MVELLTTYDLSEILIFIVLLAVAFKAVSSFIDWARDRRKKITLKEMQPDELAKQIAQETKDREKQIQELKIQREKKEGYQSDIFHLIFNGKRLENDKTLKYYGITDKSTIIFIAILIY